MYICCAFRWSYLLWYFHDNLYFCSVIWTPSLFILGVWSCYPVLWSVPTGGSVWKAASAAWTGQCCGPPTHHQPYSASEEECVCALSLAVLHSLPEVSHLHLPLLHLWTSCAAHWEVSVTSHHITLFHFKIYNGLFPYTMFVDTLMAHPCVLSKLLPQS